MDFHIERFINIAGFAVVLPTAAALLALYLAFRFSVENRNAIDQLKWPFSVFLLSRWFAGFIVGPVLAAAWLSWSASPGLEGAGSFPGTYPYWQIALCILSVGGVSIMINMWCAIPLLGGFLAPLAMSSGIAFGEAYLESFGVASQQGIGTVMALVGSFIGLLVLNFPVAIWRDKRKNHATADN